MKLIDSQTSAGVSREVDLHGQSVQSLFIEVAGATALSIDIQVSFGYSRGFRSNFTTVLSHTLMDSELSEGKSFLNIGAQRGDWFRVNVTNLIGASPSLNLWIEIQP
jgi:hypothetical protein